VTTAAADFTLPSIADRPVRLADLLAEAPAILLFVHSECPTARLTLERLARVGPRLEASGSRLVCIAQEPPDAAARLARRTRIPFPVLVEAAPYEVAAAYGVESVPTAVRVARDGTVEATSVGWAKEALERVLGVEVTADEPQWKPGCQSRNTYDEAPVDAPVFDELEDMFERGWTDGLPVVPPTPERVEAMLDGRNAEESLGPVPPGNGEATLARVAACAVLAGCMPAYFSVVLAAVEAALDPSFNLNGQAVTTQPAGQIVIVNGPVREALDLNTGMGALGPGRRSNATIGRALRLLVSLTGGGAPGRLDRATLGHPGKVGFCIAENEEASPWEPLHVERGLPPTASAATLLAGDAPLSVSDHRSRTPEQLAASLAWAAAAQWAPNWWPLDTHSLFVVCPEHAALFSDAGWSKEDLRRAIYETPEKRAEELRSYGETTPEVAGAPADAPIGKWASPDLVVIVVAGGEAGRYSAVVGPCLGMESAMITREVPWST
jgi:peroxiredoxin